MQLPAERTAMGRKIAYGIVPALLCARYFPIEPLTPYRKQLTIVLLVYTLITIVGYFVSHAPAAYDVLGIGSKLIEVTLINVLLLEWRRL